MTDFFQGTDAEVMNKARASSRDKYLARIRPVIEELLEWGYGFKAISNILVERGIYTQHGKEYNVGTVRHLLKVLNLSTGE